MRGEAEKRLAQNVEISVVYDGSCSGRIAIGKKEMVSFRASPVEWLAGKLNCSVDLVTEYLLSQPWGYQRCTAMAQKSGDQCRNADTRVYVDGLEAWLDQKVNGGALCWIHRNKNRPQNGPKQGLELCAR